MSDTSGYPSNNTGPNVPGNPSSTAGYTTSQASSANPANPTNANASTGLKTQGWYLAAAIAVSIALGNTPVGPLCFGVLTVALIYQTGLLLQGK